MPIQKLLKLQVTDDEPLRLSQRLLACILPINQQTLEHLNTGGYRWLRWASGCPWVQQHKHHPALHIPSSGLDQAGWCSRSCPRPHWTCWWPSWFWRQLCTACTSPESCKGCPGDSSCPEFCQSAGWLLHQNCHTKLPKCPNSRLMESQTERNPKSGVKSGKMAWLSVTNLAQTRGLTIFLEPSFFDHASIADDADTWEPQVLFAELN